MKSITVTDLAAIDGARIIDVREVDEVRAVRVPGAVNIPMSGFVERLDEVGDDTVYVLCAAGARSARVTAYLEQQGYDAVNVDGGIGEWQQAGLPVERG